MYRANGYLLGNVTKRNAQTVVQFFGGFVREGGDKKVLRAYVGLVDEVNAFFDDYAGLTRAGTGDKEEGAGGMIYSLNLLRGEM
jgi:hypothetical protein